MALATVSEIETRLGVPVGSLAGVDLARATAALEDASVFVLAAGMPTWTDVTVPALAKTVVLRVAKRIYDNPNEHSSEEMGDYSYRRANATGMLTAGERALVEQDAGFSYGVYSVATPSAYSEVTE